MRPLCYLRCDCTFQYLLLLIENNAIASSNMNSIICTQQRVLLWQPMINRHSLSRQSLLLDCDPVSLLHNTFVLCTSPTINAGHQMMQPPSQGVAGHKYSPLQFARPFVVHAHMFTTPSGQSFSEGGSHKGLSGSLQSTTAGQQTLHGLLPLLIGGVGVGA